MLIKVLGKLLPINRKSDITPSKTGMVHTCGVHDYSYTIPEVNSMWKEIHLKKKGETIERKRGKNVCLSITLPRDGKQISTDACVKCLEANMIFPSTAIRVQDVYKRNKQNQVASAKKRYVICPEKKAHGMEEDVARRQVFQQVSKLTTLLKENRRISMETILRKGRGAYYSSGSRPNQTAESWARARLASSVTGGKAAKYDYKHLEEGGCNANVLSMAQQWMKGENDYPWMTYKEAHKMEAKAAKHGVSVVARGPGGFMRVYEANPSKLKMQRAMYSGTQSWAMRRRNFIKRHLAQYVKHPTPRRWLAMVMWAYRHEILH